MIAWDESMTTGLPEIDSQHKEILDKFNELSEAIARGKGREVAGSVLDFLQFYALWHFEREEQRMEQFHCPAAEANKRAHAEFAARFGRFYEQYQVEGIDADLVRETYTELAKWIVHHIQQVDTQLYPYAKKASAA